MANKNARRLRTEMTDPERFVWWRVRNRQLGGHRFRRQHTLGGGRYIADFVCLESKLILELDGGQHAERATADAERTAWLNAEGYRVVRFWNHQVTEDWDAVAEELLRLLELPVQASTGLSPSPLVGEGGGGGYERATARDSRPPSAQLAPLPSPPPQGGRGPNQPTNAKYQPRRAVPQHDTFRHYDARTGGR